MHVRKDLKKMMRNWRGRQVVQPSETKGDKTPVGSSPAKSSSPVKESAKEIESSGVLV